MKRIRTLLFSGGALKGRLPVQAALLSLAALLLFSCSSAPPVEVVPPAPREGCERIDASAPQKPDWYYATPPDQGGVSHHVGISRRFVSEQDALEDAKRSAIKGLVESCGVEVEYFDSFVKTSRGQSTAGAIVEEIGGSSGGKQSAHGYVSGIKASKRYTEKYRCSSQGMSERSYQAAVLATVPVGECDRVQEWIEGEKERLGKDLDRLIATAARQAEQGDFRSARRMLAEAESTLLESSFDDSDFPHRSATVRTRQVAYFRGMLLKRIDNAVARALQLAARGDPLDAFGLLKQTETKVKEEKLHPTLQAELVGKIADAERSLVSGISLRRVGPQQVVSRDGRPVRLELKVRYGDPAGGEAVANFPIVFSGPSHKKGTSTDSGGRASHRYPLDAVADSAEIVAMVNPAAAERHLSHRALLALAAKKVRYRVDIRRKAVDILFDRLNPPPQPAFPLSVSATVERTDSGPLLSIAVTCGVRCFLKVFGINDDGTVSVWEESGERRLIKNRAQTIRIGGLKRGRLHILAVAATDPLPHRFETDRTIGREAFLALYRDFSRGPGRVSVSLKTIEIQ